MPFRGQPRIQRLSGDEWRIARETLAAGRPIVYREVGVWAPEGELHLSVPADEPKTIDEAAARAALDRAREVRDEICAADPELCDGRRAVLQVINDYGMGSTLICRLGDDGKIAWEHPYTDPDAQHEYLDAETGEMRREDLWSESEKEIRRRTPGS